VSTPAALTPGARIGPYEVVGLLGRGGMGEVYRARDSRLGRDVAIKVLLPEVANDAERVARFSREAHVLAGLNHPNIAHVHGLESTNGVSALVMELVEGRTLADRILLGAMSIDEALPLAKQIAEALEAADDQGIIHRDLKPANIKLRDDGTVKVLDFGLAKSLEPSGSTADSPTLSLQGTAAGVILGTAAYMAPEQARGKTVDRRADIWAFGCVLFEMVTGQRAFEAADVTDTIVAILTKEPDWGPLAASSSRVRPLLSRCLNKDRKQRLQAIGEARILIDGLMGGAADISTKAAPPSRRVAPAALAAMVVGATIAGLAARIFETAYARPLASVSRAYDVSADGKRFLMIKESVAGDSPRTGLVVVLNWFEDLKAKVSPP
jgi:serine/threonine-protein kinase